MANYFETLKPDETDFQEHIRTVVEESIQGGRLIVEAPSCRIYPADAVALLNETLEAKREEVVLVIKALRFDPYNVWYYEGDGENGHRTSVRTEKSIGTDRCAFSSILVDDLKGVEVRANVHLMQPFGGKPSLKVILLAEKYPQGNFPRMEDGGCASCSGWGCWECSGSGGY